MRVKVTGPSLQAFILAIILLSTGIIPKTFKNERLRAQKFSPALQIINFPTRSNFNS